MTEDLSKLTMEEKREMVTEARETFGAAAARELWVKLGLPGVALETEGRPRFPSELAERFILRLPCGVRDTIKAQAARNGRSMNTEIVRIICAHLEKEAAPASVGAPAEA